MRALSELHPRPPGSRCFPSFVPGSRNYGGQAERDLLRPNPEPKAFGPGLFCCAITRQLVIR